MEISLLLCEKCFKPMREVEVDEKSFENYHLRVIEERLADILKNGGTKQFSLTFWGCDCADKRRVITIA